MTRQLGDNVERRIFYGPLLDDHDLQSMLEFVGENRLSIAKSDGPVRAFDTAFAKSLGGGTALLSQSGTAAILSALMALGLKRGDEIIYPLFGFHACIMPARLLGLNVVFAPVLEDSLVLDTKHLAEIVSERTKAVFVLHAFGQPVDMDPILKMQRHFNFCIVADCAHAFGALYKGRPVATYSDIATFSLQQNKALGVGEGGIVWSANTSLIERVEALAYPGRDLSDDHAVWQGISCGLKFRPHALVAWLACNQLAKLPSILSFHRDIDQELRNTIKDIGLNVDFLPVSTKSTRPNGYCYLKFRLSLETNDKQAEQFRMAIVRAGKWLKPEHFIPMCDLPVDSPVAFGWPKEKETPNPSEPDQALRLRRILARQYSLRLPIDYNIKNVLDHYQHDLDVLRRASELIGG